MTFSFCTSTYTHSFFYQSAYLLSFCRIVKHNWRDYTMISRSRPRRNRYVQITLFIIIYTCYYAYSAVTIDPETLEKDDESSLAMPTERVIEVSCKTQAFFKWYFQVIRYVCIDCMFLFRRQQQRRQHQLRHQQFQQTRAWITMENPRWDRNE